MQMYILNAKATMLLLNFLERNVNINQQNGKL